MDVISSILEAVCSKLDACISVLLDKSSFPFDISVAANDILSELVSTWDIISLSLSDIFLKLCNNIANSVLCFNNFSSICTFKFSSAMLDDNFIHIFKLVIIFFAIDTKNINTDTPINNNTI